MTDKDEKKLRDASDGEGSKQLDEVSKTTSDEGSRSMKEQQNMVMKEVNYVKELSKSVRHALDETAQETWEVTKTLVAPIMDVFKRAEGDEGTELRNVVGVARKRLNVQLYAARVQLQEINQIADEQLVPVKGALCHAQQQLMKANEFRSTYPDMAAAGLAVVVGIPSLLIRGKWSAVRNSAVAISAGAATCYGFDKWVEKKRK
ncbi:unnamed protein product [Peronospora belbahrii]|uniref:Uncharacterized protein n=1 Tax=Peronospora belbahrii TaxID=622444 RepID=A0AAU9KTN1_9STRA|nr:unnamed protein product [Peronospora belbahrii]CAH0520165.1 unnamed protein product [Peronospora belbahrii]